MELKLGDVQETMLIPLVIRANESLRKGARIYDGKAIEIIKRLNCDTQKYDAFMSHEGVIARTILFDQRLKSYLKLFPNAVCVNLGCGLDDRFLRVDNGNILWYDIDLADVIQVRKQCFAQQERRTMMVGSILEDSWTKQIEKGRKTIFILEGLLMYFSKEEVQIILRNITNNFSDVVILAELMPSICANRNKYHDTVKNTKASFKWGTKSGHELEVLRPGLKLVKEDSFNIEMKKHTIRGWLFGTLPVIKNFNNRLAVYEWKR